VVRRADGALLYGTFATDRQHGRYIQIRGRASFTLADGGQENTRYEWANGRPVGSHGE
jgi:hypothetical protein